MAAAEGTLEARLRDVAVEVLGWDAPNAEKLAAAAIRRWRSFERRSRPNKRELEHRIRDLVQGLRQASPIETIYLEPGDFERLAPRFAEVLSQHAVASARSRRQR